MPYQHPPCPSPMPPNVKVVRVPINAFNCSLQNPEAWREKMLDEMLLHTLMSTVQSLGGGPVEQGKIGHALCQYQAIRSYLKDQHGSLINFLITYGGAHFTVTPGMNGVYFVRLTNT